jgi:hypothetical protein
VPRDAPAGGRRAGIKDSRRRKTAKTLRMARFLAERPGILPALPVRFAGFVRPRNGGNG